MTERKKHAPRFPEICPGDWIGEIVGSCSVNFGQVVQDGPPRQSVELTYLIMPAALAMPETRFAWPGVIMIMTPTPMKTEHADAGSLFKAAHLPALALSLDVTRPVLRHAADVRGKAPARLSLYAGGGKRRRVARSQLGNGCRHNLATAASASPPCNGLAEEVTHIVACHGWSRSGRYKTSPRTNPLSYAARRFPGSAAFSADANRRSIAARRDSRSSA